MKKMCTKNVVNVILIWYIKESADSRKGKKMKKVLKRMTAYLLAAVMVCATFTQYLPAMETQAAEISEDAQLNNARAGESESRTWIVLQGGSNNAGGHNYGNAASAGPLFYTDTDRTMTSGGSISMALKPSGNWGVFYSYIDDSNWLYVGHDSSSKWYYQYRWNGSESYPGISGLPEPTEGEELSLEISLNNETLSVTVNGTTVRVTNQTLKNMAESFESSNGSLGKFGVMTKGATKISFADFTYNGEDCMNDTWAFNAERDGQTVTEERTAMETVTGTVTDDEGAVAGATVRIGTKSAETAEDGTYAVPNVQVGEYSFSVSKAGYQAYSDTITVTEGAENVKDVVLQKKGNLDLSSYDVIESDEMTVYVGKEFPVVARYVMKDDADGNTYFRGNEENLDTMVINGVEIKPEVTGVSGAAKRISGSNRNETSIEVAEQLKAELGVEKFATAIIATGTNYPDALSGSYLANVKNAPLLLTNSKEETNARLIAYLEENVEAGATLYILGGDGAVSEKIDAKLKAKGFKIDRLNGKDRYETNAMILDRAGVEGQDTLLVATGTDYPDTLSASAVKKPILLVSPKKKLNDAQKNVLDQFKDGDIYIIGGEKAVSKETENEILAYTGKDHVTGRLSGSGRYETSVMIAETFFENPETAVVAYGHNFPDGLCGGVLAAATDAPLLLTRAADARAAKYVSDHNVKGGYVLGGSAAISDETVSDIFKASEKTYSLKLKNEANSIDLTMDVKVSVEENTLTWEVTKLEKNEGCARIATIDIPHLNLLTVESTETESVFAGARVSTTTTSKADTYITFDDGFVPSEENGYVYAFLTNGKLSAGLHSNSEIEGDLRVERINSADSMSLTSAVWYYESGDKTGQASASAYEYQTSELPVAKVAIANGDLNNDGDVDWNDGAIAFRKIMHYAQGSEAVKDLVNYRIVMNFESAAPNPFLVTADNVKKVYLATDGLPQALLLKGYGNEGHDSANSEYADIAEREGGVEDFQSLIKIAHDYNTEVGIHVNAQEAYPESRSFNETMISYANGNLIGNGWGWLDQSCTINKLWDLSSNARLKRFTQLYDRINETDFYSGDWDKKEYVKDSQGELTNGDGVTAVSREEALALIKADAATREDNMDFIYLDVWYQDAWETRRIAEEINSLGWRFTTEFSAEGEYDSTWQHWSTDTTYGGASSKGYNSDIIRFLKNDVRDSQVLNWPNFGGTADNPLLGGFRLYGFEGWGGQQDFNSYIEGTFNENVPTKFLQHYQVIDWENYGEDEKSPVGNTEKQITLANDEGDVVVVTRNEEQRSDIEIERTITLNGKVVLNTDVNESTYLLPWTDNQNGEEKLYHWNLDGGTTTWDLQDDWAKLANVVVYELSDQGRINETEVAVVNGTVTLEAEASVAYVVVKGEEAKVKTLVNDFGEYDYVTDPGFNGYAAGEQLDAADWSGDIKADGVVIKVSGNGDQRLEMSNTGADVEVSTKITGLTAGEDYVAEIYVDNESDAKATLTIDAGKKTVSNYTIRSIAGNYVACDNEHGSKMQRMQVSFVAESDTATLTLSREAGVGYTHWDDIRIVNQKVDNYKEDGSFVQDFESVVQGLYPFVLGYYTSGDSQTHLSQLNAPYTQKGWNGKAVDDVIEGEWSLKHHTKTTAVVYRTIPQNFRFEAGKVYTVEFDYQTASAGYQMIVGDGTSYTPATSYLPTATETAHATMQVVGSGSGQTWIGLYMNGSLCQNNTSTGTVDFILDNLKITENEDAVAVTIGATELYLGETTSVYGAGLDKVTWNVEDESVVSVDKENQLIKAIGAGETTVTASWGEDQSAEFDITVKDTVIKTIERSEYPDISATANTEEKGGEGDVSGYASAIVDGDSSTYWHSAWSSNAFSVSADNPAIITIDLGKTMSIGGFRFQQRNQANRVIKQYGYEIQDADGTVLETKRNITVDSSLQQALAWVNVTLGQNVEARKIIVYVEGAEGGFGCMAELEPIFVEKIATKATLEDAEVAVGKETALTAVPTDGTSLKGLVWSSSDTSVATVNADGVVTGLKKGTVTITVSNALGKIAECTVTVN